MPYSRVLPRSLIAASLVADGGEALADPAPRAKFSEETLIRLAEALGLPRDAELLVRCNAALQIAAGVALASGRLRRIAALLLIGSIAPSAYDGRRLWRASDPGARAEQRTRLLSDLALLGALLLELFDTEGAPSLSWRIRQRRQHRSDDKSSERGLPHLLAHRGNPTHVGSG